VDRDRADEELARLRKRVREDPRSLAFTALAEALRKQGRRAEALAVLRGGFRHHPDYVPGRVVLARVHLDAGNRALAIEVLDDVARVDPENLAAGTLLVKLLQEEGRSAEAVPVLRRLSLAFPGDPALAVLEAALQSRATAPRVASEDPFDSPWTAEYLASHGRYDGALSAWRRLQALSPSTPYFADRIVAVERASAGLGPAGSTLDERVPPAGVAGAWEALLAAEAGGDPPAGAERYGALARAAWRDS
jgi:tetratricopeptide (TPR) repeat protein